MLTPEEKERTAFHESGHALLGMLTPGADPVRKISIIPRGQALGVTFQSPDADRYGYSAKYLRGRIIGALGGRAAEEVVFGDMTTGAESDLDQVSSIARQMVGRWGMSEAIGPVTVLPPPGQESPLGLDGVAPATKELIDAEVRKIVDACYAEAARAAARAPGPARPAGARAAGGGDPGRGRGVRGGRHQPRQGARRGGPRREARRRPGPRPARRPTSPGRTRSAATSSRSPPPRSPHGPAAHPEICHHRGMAEIVLFHHAQGLTAGVVEFADTLRQAGHTVHTPDLYDGRTFDTLDDGMAYAGAGRLRRGRAARPARRRGAARRAGLRRVLARRDARPAARADPARRQGRPADLLVRRAGGVRRRLAGGLPVQVHGMDGDPFFAGEGDIDAARAFVAETPEAELFVYPGEAHLFADSSLRDYDEEAAALLTERVLEFLARI